MDVSVPGIMIARLDVRRLPLANESVDMIFSDPPYIKAQRETYRWLANEAARVLKPGKFIAVMCGGVSLNDLMRWFDDAGLTYYWLYQLSMGGKQTGVIWKQGTPNMPIASRIKHILVYSNGQAVARTATTDLYHSARPDKRWHHWGQTVDSHRYYIDCFSAPGDLVLDPMAGGGTTGVACSILGRRCILGDIDPGALATMRRRFDERPELLSPDPLFAFQDT
jgi:hypothetical protein